MRKEAFSKYVRRLTLLTAHQRVMLAQALAAVGTGELAGQPGAIAEKPAACPYCQASADGLRP